MFSFTVVLLMLEKISPSCSPVASGPRSLSGFVVEKGDTLEDFLRKSCQLVMTIDFLT